jgi:transcriptional regulator with XRE-family HTH domain
MGFGVKLKHLRGERSQRSVAAELKMPITTLSTLENQENVPRGEVVAKLAAFYNVPLTYFYESASSGGRSDAASSWLRSIKESSEVAQETVAFHGEDVSPVLRSHMAAVIKKKISHGNSSD